MISGTNATYNEPEAVHSIYLVQLNNDLVGFSPQTVSTTIHGD